MAETENLQVGWLKTRDGSKFTPYTLTENIYNQDGTLLTSDLNKISSRVDGIEQVGLPNLETNIFDVSGRTTDLEIRTQYLDASASDKFYITDGSGNIIAQIDNTGIKSINFTSYDGNSKIVDLNSLAAAVDGLSNTSLAEIHEKINNVSSRTTELETRTQYLDASEGSDKFYITDNNGNIIMQVDSEGIKSINFTSYNGTTKVIDLNEVYNIASANSDNIEGIMSTSLPNLSARTTELETRTQYLDASEGSDKFYITDEEGNIVMQVDAEGVKSINFTSYNGTTKVIDLNTINNTTIPALQKGIDDNKDEINGIKNTAIPGLKTELEEKISANTNSINTINTTTIPNIEAKVTKNATDIGTINSNIADHEARITNNKSEIDGLTNTTIPAISTRVTAVETRTQYVDASEGSEIFYITDKNGNIIMQVDSGGIKSINFTSYSAANTKVADLNAVNTQVNTNKSDISEIKNTTIPALEAAVLYYSIENSITI